MRHSSFLQRAQLALPSPLRSEATSKSRGKTKHCATSPNPKGEVEIVYPPISILAVPAVAWVDVNVAKHNSLALSKAYAGAKAAKRRVPAREADNLRALIAGD
jgi:hypothetical protein